MNRTCFVPGCSVGYLKTRIINKEKGLRNPSVFKAKNEAQLQMWRRMIPRKDKVCSLRDVVCERHFVESDIVRYFETKMPDGSIHRMERRNPSLKPDAVPTIFPNLPKYLSKVVRKRKAPMNRNGGENLDLRAERPPSPNVVMLDQFNNLDILAEVAAGLDTLEPVMSVEDTLDVTVSMETLKCVELPRTWSSQFLGEELVFLSLGGNYVLEKTIVVNESLHLKVLLHGKVVPIDELRAIKDKQDILDAISLIDGLRLCKGIPGSERAVQCCGYVKETPLNPIQRGEKSVNACASCKTEKRKLADRERKRRTSLQIRKRTSASRGSALKLCKRKAERLSQKVEWMKSNMSQLREECASKSEEIVNAQISNLPLPQQEAIKACFAASKLTSSTGRRYDRNWVYECLLLRMKSRKAYEHLRSNNILALPTINTLNHYLEKVKGRYGFQDAIFKTLKEKSKELPLEEKRGALLIDEMKLSKCLIFDKRTLEINGFTNLGNYTPLHQRNQRGDHALVMMYQSFRGSWVQSLASFLSRGCASATVLHHLIMECVILLEKSGFHVDLVTTDGAAWNRSMWNRFGIDSEHVSCVHPFNPSRRLWFMSDFPHLIKNIRNFFTSQDESRTPDGVVKLKHWEAVIQLDNPRGYQLKACPNLTMDHVHPKPYQKMNVRRAFQFFSKSVVAGMKGYRDRHPDLIDCDASMKFIERINTVMHALNSHTTCTALRKDSEECKAVEKFIKYLEEWEKDAHRCNYKFLTHNTGKGMMVTLKAAMELHNYLVETCNFQFLMTARLNQDSLERFFGMMRSACGSNTHPDPIVFVQIFQLLSTFSLIKPPKGSNVLGGDKLSALMSMEDISQSDDRKAKLATFLDNILEKGSMSEEIPIIMDIERDHNYAVSMTSDFVLSYFSGYVARKASRFTNCKACKASLFYEDRHIEPNEERTVGIGKENMQNYSKHLYSLLKVLEDATVNVLSSSELNIDTFFDITENIENIERLPLVGCKNHTNTLTEALIRFFIITRVQFACKIANRIENIDNENARMFRKKARLC